MPQNIEIKAKVIDSNKIRAFIETLDLRHRETLLQTDTFFNVEEGRLKLRDFRNGTADLISYRRADKLGPKLSSYEITPCPNPVKTLQELESKFGIRGVVKKVRELFLVGQTRIHLDNVEGLGTFLELEVVLNEGQSVESGQAIANDLMNRLGIEESDLIQCAYIDLLSAVA